MRIGTVGCVFGKIGQSNVYSYFADLDDQRVQIGNKVVVDVESDGYKVVTIARIDQTINPNATKWIVSHVEDRAYQERQGFLRRIKQIRDQLFDIHQKQPPIRQYEYLALIDEKAEKLLEEWQRIEEHLNETGTEKHPAQQAAE